MRVCGGGGEKKCRRASWVVAILVEAQCRRAGIVRRGWRIDIVVVRGSGVIYPILERVVLQSRVQVVIGKCR